MSLTKLVHLNKTLFYINNLSAIQCTVLAEFGTTKHRFVHNWRLNAIYWNRYELFGQRFVRDMREKYISLGRDHIEVRAILREASEYIVD